MDRRQFITQGAIALGTAAGSAGVAAFGNAPVIANARVTSAPVTIRVLSFENAVNIKNLLTVYQLYHKRHPKVTINAEVTDYADFTQKLATEIAGNNTPDLLASNTSVIPQYGSKGVLVPLGTYVGHQINLKGFVQSAIAGNRYKSKLYGIPFDVVAPAMILNLDLFDRAGVAVPSDMWTWQELKDTAGKLSKALGQGYYGTEDLSGDNEVGFEMWLRPSGKHWINANGNLGFKQSDLKAWFNYWEGLRSTGACPPGPVQAQENPSQSQTSLMAQGKAAMLGTLTPQFINIKTAMKARLGLHMIPNGFQSSGMKNQHYMISGYSESIAQSSPHKHVAADVMNFILNDPEASKIYFQGSRVPCSASTRARLLKTLATDDPKHVEFAYINQIAKGSPPAPYRAGSLTLGALFTRTAQSVALKRASVDSAVSQFFSQAPQYLTQSG